MFRYTEKQRAKFVQIVLDGQSCGTKWKDRHTAVVKAGYRGGIDSLKMMVANWAAKKEKAPVEPDGIAAEIAKPVLKVGPGKIGRGRMVSLSEDDLLVSTHRIETESDAKFSTNSLTATLQDLCIVHGIEVVKERLELLDPRK